MARRSRSRAAHPTPAPIDRRVPSRLGVVPLWLAALAIAGRVLVGVAAPHGSHLTSPSWWSQTPVEQSVAAALSLVGVALVAWLSATTLVGLALAAVGRLGGRRATLPAWWHRLSPVVVRRIVGGVVGAGLSMGAIAPAVATPERGTTATPGPSTSPPVLVLIDEPSPAPGPPGAAERTATAPPDAVIAEPVGAEPDAIVRPLTWTIEPGDHLWHVASATLAWARGQRADDAEVAAYLDRLVAANAEVVAVSGDADVVFAGQTFVLPPLEAGGATSRSAT